MHEEYQRTPLEGTPYGLSAHEFVSAHPLGTTLAAYYDPEQPKNVFTVRRPPLFGAFAVQGIFLVGSLALLLRLRLKAP